MAEHTRPLGAQISHALKARGVDVIFGIPGVHNVEMYRGIEEAGITHILTRHEQGAGFMADGYARATGKPGVAYVITGPGVCNIMTPMGQAYSDSVPMLVVASCLERKDRSMGRGRLHEMLDQEGAAATVCDWALNVPDAPGAWSAIDKAFTEFACQRPLSKYIEVPIDVLGMAAEAAKPPRAVPERAHVTEAGIAKAVEMIKSARKPLFVFGGGAESGSKHARKIVEAVGAAVVPTYAGKGIIRADYPLNFGAALARPASAAAIAEADLVVVCGSQLAEVDLWRDHLGHQAPMIRVDIDPHCLGDDHQADVPLLGDAGHFLASVANALEGHTQSSDWSPQEIETARRGFHASTEAERPGIIRIVNALADVLPEETTICSDMTQFAYVANEVYPLNQPGRWHHPSGFGTLGYGLPAAIGAKVGLGDAPVVAIAGDYGFHYTMQELGVAVELGLSLPIFLWDNQKLKEIEDSMIASQIEPNAVVAQNPDFCKLAEAFGAVAKHPATLADLQRDILAAFETKGPTLIYVTPEIKSA